MIGQNEIRLNPRAMQQAIQFWLDEKKLSTFDDEKVEVIGVQQILTPGGLVQFTITLKSLDKTVK